MKIFWIAIAGVCIIAAAFFLLRRDFNTAFVVAALGLVSWFLNYRIQMNEITAAADLEESKADNGKGVNDSDED
ncbi:MAG: hypothetical protein M3R67_02130 [Acidobacteriota bacterium]|nr:hypothetical protein [Acidobacteriota bacterium]